ncbi:MFS general substrate transporter [Dacryopinax primogenitus]|uniref:MFS general substrate transporter n=1 Tax=Dacryopinax primogenitus (strain DJM 731) TaxID=1858805 RepID=M5FXN9_DACPD|nr:MFS general substrate transporter [Dacryopinax primogenitus]EJT98276.1 MFS general substrate transporter [Dacryopinax primogenitus]
MPLHIAINPEPNGSAGTESIELTSPLSPQISPTLHDVNIHGPEAFNIEAGTSVGTDTDDAGVVRPKPAIVGDKLSVLTNIEKGSELDYLSLRPRGFSMKASTKPTLDSPSTPPSEHPTPSKERDGGILLQDQSNFLPTKQVVIVFLGLGVALTCSFLEQTMMATSLPIVSAALNSGPAQAWIITAYLLVSCAVTPLSSRFSDIFGRKVVLLFCLAEFWLFSLACAVAQTTTQMIVFRALAGIGGGCLINLALIIISDVVSLRDRGKYQGIFEIIAAVSSGVGPLLGGELAMINWRWIFWLCVIMSALATVIVWKILPLKHVTGHVKNKILQIDGIGCLLILAGCVMLLLGLNWGGVIYAWVSAPVIVTMVVGVLLMAAFMVFEAYVPRIPIVPISIFKYRTVVGVIIQTTCMGGLQYCLLFYIPQWYQVVYGLSSLRSGLMLLPYICVIAPTVLICAQIIAMYGIYRPQIWLGVCMMCVAMGLFTTIGTSTPISTVLGYEALSGIAAGCIFQTTLSALQGAVPRHEVSVATGFRNFVRLLAGTIFLAIGSAIINQSVNGIGLSQGLITQILNNPPSVHTLPDIDPVTRTRIIDAYQGGFRTVFWMLLGNACLMAIVSFTMIQHHSLRRDDDAALKAAGHKFMEERKARKEAKKSHKDLEAQTP